MMIDSVDQRAGVMSDGVSRFRNQVIFQNIIRSANYEPLSFTAVPNVVGRNSLQLGLPGTPGFNWGLHGVLQSRTLGGTSSQLATTNDFTLIALDDPATYAALLAPADAATIATFYQNSGFAPDLLNILFISRIRVAD